MDYPSQIWRSLISIWTIKLGKMMKMSENNLSPWKFSRLKVDNSTLILKIWASRSRGQFVQQLNNPNYDPFSLYPFPWNIFYPKSCKMIFNVLWYFRICQAWKYKSGQVTFDFWLLYFLVLNDRFNFTLIRIPERNYDKIK